MLSVEIKDDRSENVRYNFRDYPIYIRKALLSSYNNFEAPLHWHDDIEFIAVLSGEMEYNINGEIITLKANEGVFVNSRQLHCGFSRSKTECEFICVLLLPAMLCPTPAIERDYIAELTNNRSIAFIRLSPDVKWQEMLLSFVKDMYAAKNDASAPLTIISLFLKMWAVIYDNAEIARDRKAPNEDLTLLKNMIGFIQKHYSERITLADIASSGNIGQSKCCKLFGTYTGDSPNMYLIKYRLDKSLWYLKNADMTVTEIAREVGFSGSSYYAETFRKWYRQSPTEYRKTCTEY